ncbi:pantoate--beta-alanine ligase [Pedobacter changchengzhani]|uniref:Pantothenate synthetase n=1 Tax=Pedobacter changchengzhani TaxID=2529274 RepID=A0A4R5MMZ8_9SPHI|nr:pantoate--beta-alanine ligase [Pedobacter changchengzhani]TDG37161.1 pantoate--beta-alanine ligase [Pedobacter changchengzhani]
MEILKTKIALETFVSPLKAIGKKVALVPTMGALHNGHISLIDLAKQSADIIICSIFVNPTQFTDLKDLEKYPRPIEHDLEMLKNAGCDAVFMPSVDEMYPKEEHWHIDLGPAEFLLEGEFRKGHYQGVTQIVKKLFDAVKPDIAMFGQKDFQQVLMIKNMVAHFHLPIQIVTCPIIRESDGLAMSSRNIHLLSLDRENSLVLSKALKFVVAHFNDNSLRKLEESAKALFELIDGVELDYFTIANGDNLQPAQSKNEHHLVALVAAKVGKTRLIDNMIIK